MNENEKPKATPILGHKGKVIGWKLDKDQPLFEPKKKQ